MEPNEVLYEGIYNVLGIEEDRINKERARQREENISNFPENYKKFTEYSDSFIRELKPMLEDVETPYRKLPRV